MNLAAKLDLKKLLEESGHVLSVNDFDDLVELNRLGEEQATPGAADTFDGIGFPMIAGNAVLYPLSIGAAEWYNEYALDAVDADWRIYALAYAMIYSNDTEHLCRLQTPPEILTAIRRMKRRLECTLEQLSLCVWSLMPKPRGEQGDRSHGYANTIAVLAREYGQPPEFFVWECSIQRLQSLLDALVEARNKQIEAINATSREKQPPIRSPKFDAVDAYQKHLKTMRAKWQPKT